MITETCACFTSRRAQAPQITPIRVTSYQNFGHRKQEIYWPYSNVQPPGDFRRELSRFFRIERSYPGSHNWNHTQPGRTFMKVSQARLTVNIPLISPVLAVDYLYVCAA